MQKCGCNTNPIKIETKEALTAFLSFEIKKEPWMEGFKRTKTGLRVPVVKTTLNLQDTLGGCKVRWGIGRMAYQITPGLYAVGNPDENSVVLVTANYKLTFDQVRKHLHNQNLWILVLDTKGINVWCAAGKGTFGTQELIQKIKQTALDKIVKHRKLILPQLGAVGVAAHQVAKETGFQIQYGPVYAKDLPQYLKQGQIKNDAMKKVHFTVKDRLVLIPIEIIASKPIIWGALLYAFGLYLFENIRFQANLPLHFLPYLGAIFMGVVFVPLFLPYLMFRAFALQGILAGIIWVALLYWIKPFNWQHILYYLLLLPPVVAYLTLNFTGSTTYTSLSGVKKEMKIALPILIGSAALGIIWKILLLIQIV